MENIINHACSLCGIQTEFTCDDCGSPICEDCCIQPTYLNQVEGVLCVDCNVALENEQVKIQECEWEEEDKKEKRSKARKANYWKPENVAKRKAVKDDLSLIEKELVRKQLKETLKVVGTFLNH